jgi:predicted transcriptional regulator of viral defense system
MKSGISGSGRKELTAVTARGRRLVTVEDVAARLDLAPREAAKKLARWAEQGWLRRVRRGLYIPVPLDVEHPELWSEDPLVLADAVWSPCYFTGWTAANHWGLTEQVFRTIVVKTSKRVRTADQVLLDQDYLVGHVPEGVMEWGLRRVWRDERRVQLADEARTVIDVLDAPSIGGGIRHVAEILDAYVTDFDWRPLIEYGDLLGNRAVFKRLGYLAELLELGDQELLAACKRRLSSGVSLLDPSAPDRGPRVTPWGLRANVRIEESGSS